MNKSIFNQPLTLDVLTEISKGFPETAKVSDLLFNENRSFPFIPYGTFNAKLENHPTFLAAFLKSLHRNCFIVKENNGPAIVVNYNSLKGRRLYCVCIIHLEKGTEKINFKDQSDERYRKAPRDFYTFPAKLEIPENIIFAVPYIDNDITNKIHIDVIQGRDGSIVVDYNRKHAGVFMKNENSKYSERD